MKIAILNAIAIIVLTLIVVILGGCETPEPVYEPDGWYQYPDLPHRVFYPSGAEEVTVVTQTNNRKGFYHVRHGDRRYIYDITP